MFTKMLTKNVDEIKETLHHFGLVDYGVFGVMLFGCSAVGIWYAWKSSKKSSAAAEEEYMVGGRNMAVFPVAMSLVATFISGISLIGQPTEMYLYGTEFVMALTALLPMGLVFGYLYLPVFANLNLSSTYEYLERRFDPSVRLLGSVLFVVSMITWLPIVIYVPALAFNQVTGVNVHITTPVVCTVCVLYTCLGGLKAVVWTDVIQTCVMVGSLILTVSKGTWDIGGFSTVMGRAYDGDRLIIPSALVIYVLGIATVMLTCAYTGLLAYALYYNCDPLTTKLAANRDQILPLMVMQILGAIPGLPGLFVSGIFSASLSSLSTGLNSVAAVCLEDFVRSALKWKLSSRANMIILRGVTVAFGVLCVCLVVVVQQLGTILQTAVSLNSIASGPVFGLFTSGILLPWVNAKGALFGGITGLLSAGFVVLGAQNAVVDGKIRFPTKPVSVEGCDYYFNMTFDAPPTLSPTPQPDIFPLYRLSYMWYTPLGAVITILVALLVSCATGGCSHDVDPLTISPPLRRWIRSRRRSRLGQPAEMKVMLQK